MRISLYKQILFMASNRTKKKDTQSCIDVLQEHKLFMVSFISMKMYLPQNAYYKA